MFSLDNLTVDTPLGQHHTDLEKMVMKRVAKAWNVQIYYTKKNKGISELDGFAVPTGRKEICFYAETKTRTTRMDKYPTLIVTYRKLRVGKRISEIFKTPYVLFCYWEPDDNFRFWHMTDSTGTWLFDFERKHTKTKENIFGGEANRLNAFLPISMAKEL